MDWLYHKFSDSQSVYGILNKVQVVLTMFYFIFHILCNITNWNKSISKCNRKISFRFVSIVDILLHISWSQIFIVRNNWYSSVNNGNRRSYRMRTIFSIVLFRKHHPHITKISAWFSWGKDKPTPLNMCRFIAWENYMTIQWDLIQRPLKTNTFVCSFLKKISRFLNLKLAKLPCTH